ncbi:MAG: biopolymer transporter ExbD [Bacteroidetes bacterium]|nr:biopolymer transporter ExbD [Bacteroidota bacterium]
MAKFSKKKKEQPAIQTSSLPDIVFMLLFFFMVATVIRQNPLQVRNKLPNATEITKIESKSLTEYIYIGAPKNTAAYGDAARIQLNDAFKNKEDVIPFVEEKRQEKEPKLRNKITFSLKVDYETKMGIVTDVKQELRKAEALKILYSARQRLEN